MGALPLGTQVGVRVGSTSHQELRCGVGMAGALSTRDSVGLGKVVGGREAKRNHAFLGERKETTTYLLRGGKWFRRTAASPSGDPEEMVVQYKEVNDQWFIQEGKAC